jgi:hypothetical protein
MNNLLILVVAAMIVESVWETFKMIWQEGKLSIDKIGALILGVLIAIAGSLDLPKLVGINLFIPFLGMILTGVLMSRGANFVHDLLGKIQKPQE